MNSADWHRRYYEPERRSDLIRQAVKRDVARRVSRYGTDQAPPPPDRASELIADHAAKEQDRLRRPELRLIPGGREEEAVPAVE